VSAPTPLLRVLREAHGLICPPGGWTSGCQARNREGHSVAPTAATAASFSLYGALVKAGSMHESGFMSAYNLCRKFTGLRPGRKPSDHESLQFFSDTRGQEACLDLLNSAIDLAVRQAPLEKEPLE
jgi:hypothetical protein